MRVCMCARGVCMCVLMRCVCPIHLYTWNTYQGYFRNELENNDKTHDHVHSRHAETLALVAQTLALVVVGEEYAGQYSHHNSELAEIRLHHR